MLDKHAEGQGGSRLKVSPRMIVGGVAALVVLVLLGQNSDQVHVQLLFWGITLPLWLLLFGFAVLGALIGQAVGSYRRRRT